MEDLGWVKESDNTIHFHVPEDTKVGITLAETNRGRIRVKSVVPNQLAQLHGLRKGHILTHINDLPITDHTAAITIVNQAQDHCGSLYFTLASPSPPLVVVDPKPVAPVVFQVRNFLTRSFTRCIRPSPTVVSP